MTEQPMSAVEAHARPLALAAIEAELIRQAEATARTIDEIYLDLHPETHTAQLDGFVDLTELAAAVVKALYQAEQQQTIERVMRPSEPMYPVGGTGPTGEYLVADHELYQRRVLGDWKNPRISSNPHADGGLTPLARLLAAEDRRMRVKAEEEARELPHSRACGIRPHDHGHLCSTNCPTCQGRGISMLPVPGSQFSKTLAPEERAALDRHAARATSGVDSAEHSPKVSPPPSGYAHEWESLGDGPQDALRVYCTRCKRPLIPVPAPPGYSRTDWRAWHAENTPCTTNPKES